MISTRRGGACDVIVGVWVMPCSLTGVGENGVYPWHSASESAAVYCG